MPLARASRMILRLEGAALALGAGGGLVALGPPSGLVLAVLIAPDLSFAAYLAGTRAGNIAYNLAHSTVGPLLLLPAGWWAGSDVLIASALLWLVHCGADRALGYGLKEGGFDRTHLGPIGRAAGRGDLP